MTRIRGEHEESASELRGIISTGGGEPSGESGVWGGFTQALEGATGLIGQSPALSILETGESHGIRQYENALDDSNFPPDTKSLIMQKLLPRLREHLIELKRLKALV